MEIVPSIIARTYEEFETLIKKVEPFVNRVQIDIMDGSFVQNVTISGPEELKTFFSKFPETKLKFEVHLMVTDPKEKIYRWFETPADKFLIHCESFTNNEGLGDSLICDIKDIIKANGRLVGVVLNPETSLETIDSVVGEIDCVQLMGSEPGAYGAYFMEQTIPRITEIHSRYPEIPIQVDCGMNPETGKRAVSAGASTLIVGSYIFNSPDPEKAIQELKAII